MIRSKRLIGLVVLLCAALAAGKTSAQATSSPPAIYSKIPGWVFQAFPENQGHVRILGISDPGLPDSVAHQQAYLRGVILGAFSLQTNGAFLSDFFNKEVTLGNDSKYEEIYKFTTSYSGDLSHITILADTILKSGEAVLLLDVPVDPGHPESSDCLIAEMYLYNHEFEVSQRKSLMRKYEFSVWLIQEADQQVLDHLSFFKLNRKASGIFSASPFSQRVYDSMEYYYGIPPAGKATDSTSYSLTSCSQGLWIAYLSQILEHTSFFLKSAGDETARVADHSNSINMDLSREKKEIQFTWRIKQFRVKDQHASVEMDFSRMNDSQ